MQQSFSFTLSPLAPLSLDRERGGSKKYEDRAFHRTAKTADTKLVFPALWKALFPQEGLRENLESRVFAAQLMGRFALFFVSLTPLAPLSLDRERGGSKKYEDRAFHRTAKTADTKLVFPALWKALFPHEGSLKNLESRVFAAQLMGRLAS